MSTRHRMRGGAVVDVRLRGRRLHGAGTVVDDPAAARTYIERYPKARAAIEQASQPTFVRISGLSEGTTPQTGSRAL